MNICSEYYDNNEEYKHTHPSMLGKVVAIKAVLGEISMGQYSHKFITIPQECVDCK